MNTIARGYPAPGTAMTMAHHSSTQRAEYRSPRDNISSGNGVRESCWQPTVLRCGPTQQAVTGYSTRFCECTEQMACQ